MELFTSQLIDPFRIGLLFFLLHTAIRTRQVMGMVTPLAAGVVFVAILLPLTTGGLEPTTSEYWTAVAIGVASNSIILMVFLAAWTVWQRRG